MTNDSLFPPFYLAVIDGKEGYYDSYIVNTTDKEYFLRTRYEEKILKPKSALFYGEVIKDRDHESISPWVCDDTSETYLLYFSNLPYYCQKKTYDEYLKKDSVYQLECKIENIFKRIETIKIHDKEKDRELGTIDSFVHDEMQKQQPNIELLLSSVHYYMKIFREYNDFGKLGLLLSSLETLSIIEEFEKSMDCDIVVGIKEAIKQKDFISRIITAHREDYANHFLQKLAFLELSNDAKKQMRLDVQIHQIYFEGTTFIEYLKESGFEVQENVEDRLDRFNSSKHFVANKDGLNLEFDSIFCLIDDDVVYYLTIETSIFQKVLLDFVKNSSKWMFNIKYIKDGEQSSFEVEYDNCKNSWY